MQPYVKLLPSLVNLLDFVNCFFLILVDLSVFFAISGPVKLITEVGLISCGVNADLLFTGTDAVKLGR